MPSTLMSVSQSCSTVFADALTMSAILTSATTAVVVVADVNIAVVVVIVVVVIEVILVVILVEVGQRFSSVFFQR